MYLVWASKLVRPQVGLQPHTNTIGCIGVTNYPKEFSYYSVIQVSRIQLMGWIDINCDQINANSLNHWSNHQSLFENQSTSNFKQ